MKNFRVQWYFLIRVSTKSEWDLFTHSLEVETVFILDDLGFYSFAHFTRQNFTRLYAHLKQFLELCDADFVTIKIDVGQPVSFLEIDGYKFAILSFFFLVN